MADATGWGSCHGYCEAQPISSLKKNGVCEWPNLGFNMPAGAAWAVSNLNALRHVKQERKQPRYPVDSFNPRQRAVARLASKIRGA